jgi:predicted nuclease of predicted toxin-antitoxin system
MKLLLDQGLPRSTAVLLRQSEIDAVHVGEIGLATAEDITILEEGRRSGRVVVTLDADFHALMALSGATSPSVIRIRIEGFRSVEHTRLLKEILKACKKDLETGALVSVQPGRMRIKRLSLIQKKSTQ